MNSYFWCCSLIVALSLFSCNSKKEQTIDLEEIIGETEGYQPVDSVKSETVAFYQPKINQQIALEYNISWDSTFVSEELTIPERFNPLSTEKFTYWKDGNSVDFAKWNYKDSTKSMSAFLNWMNCYGEKCTMIELRSSQNIQRSNLLIMQNDTCIVQLQSSTLPLSELNKWKKMYFDSAKKSKWNYIISQPKGGKVTWGFYLDKKEHFLEGK
jgi:hypothetical protein